jgi:UDP-N-acetylmuramyl pentapeptide phosphotransferase/UDP-N-acetylglucosamine-1-phosphate transferase
MKYLAQDSITNPVLGPSLQSKTGVDFFQDLIPRMVGLAFLVGVLVFFFIMITGAIQWITSGGDKAGIESARGKITNAIVGVVILLSLFALLKVIEDFFGINILALDIGPLIIQ